jgi:hypothetical protein
VLAPAYSVHHNGPKETLMKTFTALALLLGSLTGSIAAHAAETLTGDAAKAKWEEILPASVLIENTTAVTTIRFGKTTCTLIGSHGGSAAAIGETYTCEINN